MTPAARAAGQGGRRARQRAVDRRRPAPHGPEIVAAVPRRQRSTSSGTTARSASCSCERHPGVSATSCGATVTRDGSSSPGGGSTSATRNRAGPDHTLVRILAARGPVGRPHASAAARRAARCSSVRYGRVPSAGRGRERDPLLGQALPLCVGERGARTAARRRRGGDHRPAAATRRAARCSSVSCGHVPSAGRVGSVTPCSARHWRSASVSAGAGDAARRPPTRTGVAGVGGGERVEARTRARPPGRRSPRP